MTSRLNVLGGRLLAAAVALLALVAVVWLLVVLRRALPDDAVAGGSLTAPTFPAETTLGDTAAGGLMVPDSMLGRSRALRFAALTAAEADAFPALLTAFGDTIIHTPGTFTVMADSEPFHFFIMRPFAHKRDEMLGAYRLGWWPAERWMMAENYLNPDGFVEVRPAEVETRLPEHFRLGDFLTHDQQAS